MEVVDKDCVCISVVKYPDRKDPYSIHSDTDKKFKTREEREKDRVCK